MNSVDKISRESKVLLDDAKDVFTANLVNAVRAKTIVVDESQLPAVINLLNISIDESFQRALPFFQRTIRNERTASPN